MKVRVSRKDKSHLCINYSEKEAYTFLDNKKKINYEFIIKNKTFSYKLEVLDVGESYFEKWIEEIESFDFFNLDIFDNRHHVEQIYNMISALDYKPKSQSLKRLISWVDSLTEDWSSNFHL